MAIVKRIASEGYVDEKALYEVNKAVENLPQADWNQNDEAAVDFIKNRTHYENVVETSVVLADEEVYLETLPDFSPSWPWSEPITLENGKTYTVTVDDVKREIVCENDELIFVDAPETEDTLTIKSEVILGERDWTYRIKIEVIEVSGTLKQLDEKFIPNIIARVSDIPDVNTMQPLTFTGAVNATYDGSQAVNVEIPESGVTDEQIASAVEDYMAEHPIKVPDSSENVDFSVLTLGYHTDGLVYIFANGVPVGNGIKISGGIGTTDVITVADGVMTISALAKEPTQNEGVLNIK